MCCHRHSRCPVQPLPCALGRWVSWGPRGDFSLPSGPIPPCPFQWPLASATCRPQDACRPRRPRPWALPAAPLRPGPCWGQPAQLGPVLGAPWTRAAPASCLHRSAAPSPAMFSSHLRRAALLAWASPDGPEPAPAPGPRSPFAPAAVSAVEQGAGARSPHRGRVGAGAAGSLPQASLARILVPFPCTPLSGCCPVLWGAGVGGPQGWAAGGGRSCCCVPRPWQSRGSSAARARPLCRRSLRAPVHAERTGRLPAEAEGRPVPRTGPGRIRPCSPGGGLLGCRLSRCLARRPRPRPRGCAQQPVLEPQRQGGPCLLTPLAQPGGRAGGDAVPGMVPPFLGGRGCQARALPAAATAGTKRMPLNSCCHGDHVQLVSAAHPRLHARRARPAGPRPPCPAASARAASLGTARGGAARPGPFRHDTSLQGFRPWATATTRAVTVEQGSGRRERGGADRQEAGGPGRAVAPTPAF